jgi:hypothetical protein
MVVLRHLVSTLAYTFPTWTRVPVSAESNRGRERIYDGPNVD